MADNAVIIASAAFMVLAGWRKKKKEKKTQRRCWMTALYESRTRCRARHVLRDLQVSYMGQLDTFLRIAEQNWR